MRLIHEEDDTEDARMKLLKDEKGYDKSGVCYRAAAAHTIAK